jgi:SNF2 family DNA or RNA helicase
LPHSRPQTLAFLNYLVQQNCAGPFLVVVPLVTLRQWEIAFREWTDLAVLVFYGNPDSLKVIRELEIYRRNRDGRALKHALKFQILLTTYDRARLAVGELSKFEWQVMVADEAHV